MKIEVTKIVKNIEREFPLGWVFFQIPRKNLNPLIRRYRVIRNKKGYPYVVSPSERINGEYLLINESLEEGEDKALGKLVTEEARKHPDWEIFRD